MFSQNFAPKKKKNSLIKFLNINETLLLKLYF